MVAYSTQRWVCAKLCQAPAQPAPKSESIAPGQHATARRLNSAKSSSQLPRAGEIARQEVPGISYVFSYLCSEQLHLCKMQYGRYRWVMV